MRGSRGRLWLGVLAVAVAVALSAPAAEASLHPFMGVVAKGKPTGAPAPNDVTPMDDACGLAIDSSGHLYVSDYHPETVQIYADGSYLTQFSTLFKGESSACALAVDSAGNLFANNLHQSVVRYVPSTYPFAPPSFPDYSASTTIDAGRSTGLALDPSTDTLYVTHRDRVSAYEAPASEGDVPTTIGSGALSNAYGAAVSGFADTLGYLYVADAADDTVEVFDPATDTDNPIAMIDGGDVPLGEFRDLTDTALAIDDSNGHLFVLDNLRPGFEEPTAAAYEFDADGEYLGQLQQQIVHGGPSGLAVDNSVDPGTGQPRGAVYVTSGNRVRMVPGIQSTEEGSVVLAFCPAIPAGPCASFPYLSSHALEAATGGSGEGSVRSAQSGIDCGAICAWEFDQGTAVTLIATPRPHSTFSGWSVSGQPGACPGTGTCKVTISADTEVTASFQAIPQGALSVSRIGTGQGTVTSSAAGIECGVICIAGFDQGSVVTLTAEAAVGSEFTGWSGAGCEGVGSCKVPMGSEQSVSAEFRAIPRLVPVDKDTGRRTLAISVSGEGAGTITSDPGGIECGTPCSSAYAPGTKVTLTAKPDNESAFSGWSGCDSSKGTTCTVTLGSSKTVGASFTEAVPLEIAGVSLNGAKATLSVVVPSKGALQAKAKQLKPVSVKARKAETLSLPLTLNKSAKKALTKKGKLKVKVMLSFKPAGDGAPRTLEKTVTFRAKKAVMKSGGKK